MKIKYFRFLYYGRKGCFLHLGEVEDTRSGENVTFLYVGGNGGTEIPPKGADREVSYPKRIDLLILGERSEGTEAVLEEILEHSEVGTLIYPEAGGARPFPGEGKAESLVCLGEGMPSREFLREVAGWKLHVGSLESGSLVLLHGLARPEKPQQKPQALPEGETAFDDCVMNVSVLDGKERSGWWEETDGFAAAMRCMLHQDYDVCRRQNGKGSKTYVTETLLYGGTHLGRCLDWIKTSEGPDGLGGRLRFLSVPTQEQEELWDGGILEQIPEGHKCYYISAPGKPAEQAAGQICTKNPYQVLHVTGEGTGISCAGFLKYAE